MDKLSIDYTPGMSWTDIKKQIKEKRPMDTATLTVEDFKKCQQKLLDNDPDIYWKNNFGITPYANLQALECKTLPGCIKLGTLPDSNKKENTMFRDQCFDIPAPTPQWKAKSTSANIDLQVNMPSAQDPAAKGKDHLLQRAGKALSDKDFALRGAYNLIPDDEPETIKDFIQRIKDGKITLDLTEKEQAERKFYSVERILEEIMWQDPARKPDQDGFNAASKTLRQAYNDTSDEIIVKTPDQGLESLRAFQAKTFN